LAWPEPHRGAQSPRGSPLVETVEESAVSGVAAPADRRFQARQAVAQAPHLARSRQTADSLRPGCAAAPVRHLPRNELRARTPAPDRSHRHRRQRAIVESEVLLCSTVCGESWSGPISPRGGAAHGIAVVREAALRRSLPSTVEVLSPSGSPWASGDQRRNVSGRRSRYRDRPIRPQYSDLDLPLLDTGNARRRRS
jgi:hypothetical protein